MKTFPIQGWFSKPRHAHVMAAEIPWDMIAPHEAQAIANHSGQSLERLAQRGGLGLDEAIAVLEDRKWHRIEDDEAYHVLFAMVRAWEEQQS